MALTTHVAPPERKKLAAERCSLPTHMVGSAAATQFNQWFDMKLDADCTDLQFSWSNFKLGNEGNILPGDQPLTIHAGFRNNGVVYDLGSKTIQPGITETVEWAGSAIAGALRVQYFVTSPVALTSWPTGVNLNATHQNEMGTGLTDRAAASSWSSPQNPQIRVFLPPTKITCTSGGAPKAIEVWGDSIGSGGTHDVWRADVGFVMRALNTLNIPSINNGADGMALFYYDYPYANAEAIIKAASKSRRWSIRDKSITHILIQMCTNDLAQNQSDTDLYAHMVALRNEMRGLGIKVIVCTCPPRTNAANNAKAEYDNVAVWSRRINLNNTIRANNGVGDGYIDVAAVTQSSGNNNLWRTDVSGGYGDDGIHMQSNLQAEVAAELVAKLPAIMGTWTT